jgi:hypothetical protein
MSYRVVILSQESYFSQFRQFFEPKQGVYGPGEVALLGAQWSILAGGSCDAAEIEFGAPFYFRSRDRLAIYLLPSGGLVWQGEIRSEPWRSGGGTVRAVGYAENVGKSPWYGAVSNTFESAIYDIISRCQLPIGVGVGTIASTTALVKSNPAFELLGSTLNTAATALNGGAWGVNAALQIFVSAYSDEVGHFFYINESEVVISDVSNPFNGVRLEVKDGQASYTWEGNIPGDAGIHGSQYEVMQIPAFLALDSDNILGSQLESEAGYVNYGQFYDVEYLVLGGLRATDLRAGDQIRFALEGHTGRPAVAPAMNDSATGAIVQFAGARRRVVPRAGGGRLHPDAPHPGAEECIIKQPLGVFP